MRKQLRVEIIGKDEFWRKAIFIEWEQRYPGRLLVREADGSYLIDSEWFDSLRQVAEQCNSRVLVAPENPGRRSLFRRFLPDLN